MSLNRVEVAVIVSLFNFLLFGLLLARTDLQYFNEVYTLEDGVVETLSVVALLGAAGVCITRFFRLRSVRSPLFLACVLGLAAVFVFGAGEELSWGQRILGIESSDFFKTHNAQAETNLHNLVVGGVKINKLVFGTLLALVIVGYVVVLPLLYRKVERVRALTDALAVPVPRLVHLIVYLSAFAIVAGIPSKRHGELLELAGCFLFLLIVLYPANRSVFERAD